MPALTTWEKISLLIWKNWKSEKNHIIKLIVEILLPSIFTLLLIVSRLQFENKQLDSSFYQHVSTNKLHQLWFVTDAYGRNVDRLIVYTPKNSELKKIVESTANFLGLKSEHIGCVKYMEEKFRKSQFLAGIVFDESLRNIRDLKDVRKFSFTLRFPKYLRSSLPEIPRNWLTNRRFPYISPVGPRNPETSSGGIPSGYWREGFITLQSGLTRSFLQLANIKSDLPDVKLMRFPYPEFTFDGFLDAVHVMLPIFLMISYMFSSVQITKKIVREKEKRHKAIMKMMGVTFPMQWIAWFLHFFTILLLATIFLTMILKVPVKGGAGIFTKTPWDLLFVYLVFYICAMICFCFLISTFFYNTNAASTLTCLVLFFAYFPYIYISDDSSVHVKLFWCLVPTAALCFGVKIICIYEMAKSGLKWQYLFTPIDFDNKLSVGAIMMMMLLSCLLNMVIVLYLEQIWPGEGSMAKKWYFPLTKSFRRCSYALVQQQDDMHFDAFEKEPTNKTAGLRVFSLRKTFGEKVAVRDVSLNMYEDEITVLLGHNGAGKTTLISMLTGFLYPTSGTASINGYDILLESEGARRGLGICPQNNSVFEDLTVMDHLIFYGRLKGVKYKDAEIEAKVYLKAMNLERKATNRSATLSGGMQRKLCICCAFCGGAKVVFCDEPSSGLDPFARRQLWNFLKSQKTGRTIVLTTHYMDEADALGDRIAIMCQGEIKCCGSSFFLKKKYGSGYRLVCVKEPGCKAAEVTNLLRKYIPDIAPENNIGNDLSYIINNEYSSIFEKLFSDLDNSLQELQINGYGIGISSLEEVFMKVGSESACDVFKQSTETPLNAGVIFMNDDYMLKGWRLQYSQLGALIWKKILYCRANWLLLLILLVIPIIFVAFVFRETLRTDIILPKIDISLKQYPTAVVIADETNSADNAIIQKYKEFVKSFGSNYILQTTKTKPIDDYLIDISSTKQVDIDTKYLAGITVSDSYILAWFNNQLLHTAPLSINLIYNAIARSSPNGANVEIVVSNWPFHQMNPSFAPDLALAGEMALSFTFCIGVVTSFFVLYLVKERQSRFKLLQFISGARVSTFWIVHLIFDYLIFVIIIFFMMVAIGCYQQNGYDTIEALGCLALIFIAFGFAVLPFLCLLSFIFKDTSAAFAIMCCITFLGMGTFVMFSILSLPGVLNSKTVDHLQSFLMLSPHFTFAWALFNLGENIRFHEICSIKNVCVSLPECCSEISGFWDWKNPGILKEIMLFIISGTVWTILLHIIEIDLYHRLIIFLSNKFGKHGTSIVHYKDEDVLQEMERIKRFTKYDIDDYNLVLNQVSKNYCRFKAVNDISLTVQRKVDNCNLK